MTTDPTLSPPQPGPSSTERAGGGARRLFRRAPWEHATTALIALGLVMMMQPWWIEVYGYSFPVLLLGVVGYSVAGKLPR